MRDGKDMRRNLRPFEKWIEKKIKKLWINPLPSKMDEMECLMQARYAYRKYLRSIKKK